MTASTHLRFTHRPSNLGLFFTMLRNSRAHRSPPEAALNLRASWHDIAIDQQHLQDFHAACGLDLQEGISILYPMTLAYPLIQYMLSNTAAPMPMFRVLNTRMQMQQTRALRPDDRPSVDMGVAALRSVPKGLELDVQVNVQVDGTTVWECLMTFFYRGRFAGEPVPMVSDAGPRVREPEDSASWRLPASGALRFGKLSGDTNPIHYGRLYAKAFGFERDFAQPLLVIGQALRRLPRLSSERQRLEARLKGPVYYERELTMLTQRAPQGHCFEVYCAPNPKPSICVQVGLL
ncbi:MAG TPA: hypothetical protein VGE12_03960 [Noviherbaspirillum sp.]